jgi:hypothetical protein
MRFSSFTASCVLSGALSVSASDRDEIRALKQLIERIE